MPITTTIKVGESAKTITLNEGKVLLLTGAANSAGVAYQLDLVRGGTNSVKSWTVGAGALPQIGPFASTQKVMMTCSAGSISATVGEASPTAPQFDVSSSGDLLGLKGPGAGNTGSAALRTADRTAAATLRADIVIYGATFAGVMAACTAAQSGVSVLLISENGRLGGMMTGGLARVDYRGFNPRTCMNVMTMEFFRRCAAVYGMSLGDFGMDAISPYAVEPKVALAVLRDMLNEYQVPVLFNFRVTAVNKQAGDIRYLDLAHRLDVTRTKRVFGRMFGEGSYSSNLLIRAGISFTYGREANATYGETFNGVQPSFAHTGNPSAYVIAGNAGSGLLPYIDPAPLEAAGTADNRLQAFCYRLVMTNDPAIRLPVPDPATYSPLWYEVLGRSMAAAPASYQTLDQMFYRAAIPLGGVKKQDWNSNGSYSTDFAGGNFGYVTNDYAAQDQIVLNHTNYTLGLFKFLREDSRVPAALKTSLADWGFCSDEFVEDGTAGLSPELYVREAARMVGDYTMTESNYNKVAVPAYPVINANYAMDSHICSRRNVSGLVRSEGGLSSVNVPVGYYGIEYRCMLPKANECGNYANFCNGISVSHTLFGSARMEVTFGSLGEAAATAMVLAIKNKMRLHDINPADIQAAVRPYAFDAARVLTLNNGAINTGSANSFGKITTSGPGTIPAAGWSTAVFPPEFYGTNMWNEGNGNKGGRFIQFHPAFASAGRYRIMLNAPGTTNAQRKCRIDVQHADGLTTFYIDHKFGEWHFRDLGVWRFLNDGSCYIKITNAGDPADPGSDAGLMSVDGVAWSPVP
ncbi:MULTISPECIES: FAD-dependent oxidoreductase [unclassified Duganella]|uniref:FAD-dependent oxidoreductase n=1 Tax=unclassified Duganella TaxID=2636909 RepID=UPI00088D1C05|nr:MULTISPECIES: FAD-dependent oxidoreductase [unclassified Duganella]SDF81474.1 FAD dependent oxidoreductase [Duganella sp. OV458]SDI48014.1 FAD dependent oxidoreductase [Duganella sp. OV510]